MACLDEAYKEAVWIHGSRELGSTLWRAKPSTLQLSNCGPALPARRQSTLRWGSPSTLRRSNCGAGGADRRLRRRPTETAPQFEGRSVDKLHCRSVHCRRDGRACSAVRRPKRGQAWPAKVWSRRQLDLRTPRALLDASPAHALASHWSFPSFHKDDDCEHFWGFSGAVPRSESASGGPPTLSRSEIVSTGSSPGANTEPTRKQPGPNPESSLRSRQGSGLVPRRPQVKALPRWVARNWRTHHAQRSTQCEPG